MFLSAVALLGANSVKHSTWTHKAYFIEQPGNFSLFQEQ